MTKPIQVDWRPLYDQGLTDQEIADKLGCTVNLIGARRRAAGLPSVAQRNNDAEYQRLYDAGYCDAHVAQVMGCTKSAVANWRKRNGLPFNQDRDFYKKNKVRLLCETCKWGYKYGQACADVLCDYYAQHGVFHRRGCPPPTPERNECAKYEPRRGSRRP